MTRFEWNPTTIEIQIARTPGEILETFDVMQQLRPNLERSDYATLIRSLMEREGFVLVALRDDGTVRSVAGFRTITMLYRGRILYVDDLVSDARSRSKGFGAMMLDWIKEEAGRRECKEIQLISRTFRLEAHRFYERHGFRTECRHLVYPLKDVESE